MLQPYVLRKAREDPLLALQPCWVKKLKMLGRILSELFVDWPSWHIHDVAHTIKEQEMMVLK